MNACAECGFVYNLASAADVPSLAREHEPDLIAEIRELWRGTLRPVRPESLHPALRDQLRDFLATVGLPQENCWDATFFHDRPPREPLQVEGRGLVVVGDDHGMPVAVDTAEGSVWSVVPGVPRPLRLLNSSLPVFLYAFGRVDALSRAVVDSRLVEGLRNELAALDPPSMAAGATQWPDYLDEVAG
ncbi:SUKH-4 family immunity protein [Nocardia sp. NBC_00881]|uniref:SUKH-4 family immunity protein n=1 Tax=Nocardia sp. NBC_00881 TaxID=2975995 RepID=UPI00386C0734|nr:SUKH-4 family immunity protein [Nocardia sp. NBC_00881]